MQRLLNSRDIELLRAGDEAVFGLIYDLYSSKIYTLAFRFLKDSARSEEIVQETFIKLWQSRINLDSNGDLWLYIYVIAKRLSLNTLRELSRSASFVRELLIQMEDLHCQTEQDILAKELEAFSKEVISRLPKQQQLVFQLSRNEGLSHKEIAEVLKISPNTVKNHMVEALKTLRMQLKYTDLIYLLAIFHSLK